MALSSYRVYFVTNEIQSEIQTIMYTKTNIYYKSGRGTMKDDIVLDVRIWYQSSKKVLQMINETTGHYLLTWQFFCKKKKVKFMIKKRFIYSSII